MDENIILDEFFQAGEKNLHKALEILIKYKQDFKSQQSILEYDNYENNSRGDECFQEASKLNRYYKPINYNNNLETLSNLLLDHSLNYTLPSLNLDVLDFLLKNRIEFNIKDEYIIQFLTEKVYDINGIVCEDPTNSELFKQNLTNLIYILIDNNVIFQSDTQGYLAQIVSFNQLPNEKHLLILLNERGSSLDTFVKRYQNTTNHLDNEQIKSLFDFDFNYNRQYNIYKKFDDVNCISKNSLEFCSQLILYKKLDTDIEKKELLKSNKIKI